MGITLILGARQRRGALTLVNIVEELLNRIRTYLFYAGSPKETERRICRFFQHLRPSAKEGTAF